MSNLRFPIAAWMCVGLLAVDSFARAQPDGSGAPAGDQRFALPLQIQPAVGTLAKVMPNGSAEMTLAGGEGGPPMQRQAVAEGYYLGLVRKSMQEPVGNSRLVRVKVAEVGASGLKLELPPAAAQSLQSGEVLMLFRPAGSTTEQMKSLPDYATLELNNDMKAAQARAGMTISMNNMKQIALAMHNYHDANRAFPPAVVYGPDGKPWHSWRILILPYLGDDAELYKQYKFDEPWDGPNNSKLLSKIPKVYSDPVLGDNKEFLTTYVVPVGDKTAFQKTGAKMDGAKVPNGAGARLAAITDGTSNTVMVSLAGPDQKIPWLKPEDVEVGDSIADLGTKGSFGAPYTVNGKAASLIAMFDGSVRAVAAPLAGKTLYPLLTRAGGEIVDFEKLSGVAGGGERNARAQPVIVIRKVDGGVKAILQME